MEPTQLSQQQTKRSPEHQHPGKFSWICCIDSLRWRNSPAGVNYAGGLTTGVGDRLFISNKSPNVLLPQAC
ncbi:MAG: hypothetical protein V7K76_14435 [Nostoc sp.]|uniref:hypothetical protein n=1 Tax=Nostoc sp. TaxID=1180 RepID=UPI002FF93A07